mmetsp:Transcript_31563/g.70940  ORF Transcript_31563/g.70940 Transcript_31563/m.70940 type:complete len:580 (-) Transcript_31563:354-2093(-)
MGKFGFGSATPTPAPTVNYWATSEGQAIASTTALVVTLVLILLLGWVSREYLKKEAVRRSELNQGLVVDGDIGDSIHSSAPSTLAEGLAEGGTGSLASSLLVPEWSVTTGGGATGGSAGRSKRQYVGGLLDDPSVSRFTVALYWALTLLHVSFVAAGLLAYWGVVHFQGTATTTSTEGEVETIDIDVEVYSSTFGVTLKEFWNAGAHSVAGLLVVAGIAAPCVMLVASIVIAFGPLTDATRHRMISFQEVMCKVPLATFWIEAYFVIAFKVRFVGEFVHGLDTYHVSGKTVINVKPGLMLFLFGQIMLLALVTVLRLEHRRQTCPEARAQIPVLGSAAQREGDEGPSPSPRPGKLKAAVTLLALGLIATTLGATFYKFLQFKYTGAVKPYIKPADGQGSFEGDMVLLNTSLWEMFVDLSNFINPKFDGVFFALAGFSILVINPLALAAIALYFTLVVRDDDFATRRRLGEWAQTLQTWCCVESIFLATVFLCPNVKTVTEFVFDDNNACDELYSETGEECFVVSSRVRGVGSYILLVLYLVFEMGLIRFLTADLEGRFGRRPESVDGEGRRVPSSQGSL